MGKKYFGPYQVVDTPSPVSVIIQRTVRAKPFTVHVDKVKQYLQEPPKSWLKSAGKNEVTVQVGDGFAVPTDGIIPSQDDHLPEAKLSESPVPSKANIRLKPDVPQSLIAGPNSDYTVDEPALPRRPKRATKLR